MSKRVELYTTMSALEELSAVANKGRAKVVTVSRARLLNLVMDHGLMVARLEELGENPGHGKSGE